MNRNFLALRVWFVACACAFLAASASAATISMFWEPSPSADVAGYAIYYGNKSGDYTSRVDAGSQTNFVFAPAAGSNYFFVVTAYTAAGLESLPSSEVAYQPDATAFDLAPGTFIGLFDAAPSQQSLGAFTLKKGTGTSFSGTISLNGRRYRFTGKPDPSGVINIMVNRFGATPLILTLNVDPNEKNSLTGTLSDGDWTMQLNADRATFNSKTNASPYVGKYTFAVMGIAGEPLTPGGIGFGSIRVLPNGMVQAKGTLGDGKNFANSAYVSAEGIWPLYVAAYGRFGGLISGWLKFETNGTESIHGDLNWIKPTLIKNKFYPGGFSNSVALIGSSYHPTTTNQILELTNATFTVSGGGLSNGFVKDVLLSTNKILPAVVGADGLAVKIQINSGLFGGKIRIPDSAVPVKFRGALLQNQNAGYGLFLRTNQVGDVRLEPIP